MSDANVMSEANAHRFDPRGASLLLAGGMCLIPFLQPRHFLPIRTFYDEWLALALGLAAIGLAAAARRDAVLRVPALALWLAAFALVLLVRALGNQAAYAQLPVLWALYTLFAALLVTLGHDLATGLGRERVCDTLAVFLLAGALANAGAGVLQVVGIPRELDSFVAYLQGGRAVGNVGHANLYANYLALGEASLLYLFARGKIGRAAALSGALLLTASAALAASRTSALYAAYFAVLGWSALHRAGDARARRLGIAAIVLALGAIALQWIVPAGLKILGASIEGGLHRDSSFDPASGRGASAQLRMLAWGLAWRVFVADPWLGVGPGEFAGAAYALGLPPAMAAEGIWTSPHNLILQLLCEAGLSGALIVGAGLAVWLRRSAGEFVRGPDPAMWWIAACTGVELVHALIEYPLWYAHFLGITALVMGIGAGGVPTRLRAFRTLLAACVVAGAVLLAVTLKDYLRFDLASPVSAGRSLATESEVVRDRAALRELSRGLLAPRTELWLFLALALDPDGLAEKIAIGERLLRVWPSDQVVVRQSVFLALAGRNNEALALLMFGLETFKNRRTQIGEVVAAAPREARTVLQPALQQRLD